MYLYSGHYKYIVLVNVHQHSGVDPGPPKLPILLFTYTTSEHTQCIPVVQSNPNPVVLQSTIYRLPCFFYLYMYTTAFAHYYKTAGTMTQ